MRLLTKVKLSVICLGMVVTLNVMMAIPIVFADSCSGPVAHCTPGKAAKAEPQSNDNDVGGAGSSNDNNSNNNRPHHTHSHHKHTTPSTIVHENPSTPSSSRAGKAYFAQTTDMPSNSPVYIVSTSMNKDFVGSLHIAGEVKNNGTQAVSLVDVISSFYDRNGLLLTSIEAFARPDTLEPSQSAPFSLDVVPPEAPLEEIDHVKYHLTWTSPSKVKPIF